VILNALRGLGERLGRGVKECATMLQPNKITAELGAAVLKGGKSMLALDG
jgi:hypothetical protein